MSTFTIKGNRFLHKFWSRILKTAQKKTKKYQDRNIDISNILIPTPSTIIIKYSVIDTGKKYELVIQGKYPELYKKSQEGNTITSDDINAESIIRNDFKNGHEIN